MGTKPYKNNHSPHILLPNAGKDDQNRGQESPRHDPQRFLCNTDLHRQGLRPLPLNHRDTAVRSTVAKSKSSTKPLLASVPNPTTRHKVPQLPRRVPRCSTMSKTGCINGLPRQIVIAGDGYTLSSSSLSSASSSVELHGSNCSKCVENLTG